MNDEFNKSLYNEYLIKGNLHGAIDCLKAFPAQATLYEKYISVFEKENYLTFGLNTYLEKLLMIYQQYYRDVFYLDMDEDKAIANMTSRFSALLGISKDNVSFDEIEEKQISDAFTGRGFHFLGGITSGHYGPYIWKDTQSQTFHVELPDGDQVYTVRFLDGFVSKSWLDYLSFGKIGTGGWTDSDGIINCVKKSYDLENEIFQVSLLKHEAQHAMDLQKYKDMPSADLEYRAKLVELIYSSERNLLTAFMHEADSSLSNNGHSLAASRIVRGFSAKRNENILEPDRLSIKEIQSIAKELFIESDKQLAGN